MGIKSSSKGRSFEQEVEGLLRQLERLFPKRVEVKAQEEMKLPDGRSKYIDFGLTYEMISSRHIVAIECQDRESWSADILDKILSIRTNTYRNRFWFVYRNEGFLSENVKEIMDKQGVMHFSFGELARHLELIKRDLFATEEWITEKSEKEYRSPVATDKSEKEHRSPPADPSMLSR